MSGTTGQTHTKINPRTGKPYYYKDNPEKSKKRRAKYNPNRMFVDGKYIPKSHPLHKPGRYEGFEEAAFSALQNYKSSKKGEVYIITNPAFEGWVKVGMGVDAMDRLKGYQTSTPFRDFEIQSFCKVDDRRAAEAEIHRRLESLYERRGEWFKCSVDNARDEMICVKINMDEL